jgi:hypothetical protein
MDLEHPAQLAVRRPLLFLNDGTVFKLTVPVNPPPYPINQITNVHISGLQTLSSPSRP